MKITPMVVGMYGTNAYVLEEGNDVILIDPASKVEKFEPYFEGKNLVGVLLTHGHFDHIKACNDLYNKHNCPIYLHKDDEKIARDKSQRVLFGLPYSPYITCPINHLEEGKMDLGAFHFNVIHTPGHSDGSCCFVFDDVMFSGDTLFYRSVGRTDLMSGSETKLKASLRLLKDLNPELIVYPGHDQDTILKDEIENNPYFV